MSVCVKLGMDRGRFVNLHKVKDGQGWVADRKILDMHAIAMTLGVLGVVNGMEF